MYKILHTLFTFDNLQTQVRNSALTTRGTMIKGGVLILMLFFLLFDELVSPLPINSLNILLSFFDLLILATATYIGFYLVRLPFSLTIATHILFAILWRVGILFVLLALLLYNTFPLFGIEIMALNKIDGTNVLVAANLSINVFLLILIPLALRSILRES